MSDIPDTETITVARIAAALEIARVVRSNDTSETRFDAFLERFEIAYKRIKMADRPKTE